MLVAGVLTGALFVGTGGLPAHADDSLPGEVSDSAMQTVKTLVDVDEAALDKVDSLVGGSVTAVDGIAVSESAIVALPEVGDESMTLAPLDGAESISVVIPNAEVSTSDDGAVLLEDEVSGDSFVVHATELGGIQILNIAHEPTDQHAFEVDFSLPTGTEWVTTESGSLELRDTLGTALAVIDVPWAVDANGVSLPTRFVVEGEKIIQIVDTDGAAFPVMSDPSLWWIIGTSAFCAAEIASLAVGAAKVVQAFAKAEKVVKAAKAVTNAYKELGGKMDKVVDLLKKYVKNKTKLTKKQINALETFIHEIGKSVLNIIGLGSCVDLATRK